MTFADINDLGRGIYSVLAFSGYLTAAYDADSMSYRLRIPNREMYGVFSERILDRLEGTMSGRMRRLSASLLGTALFLGTHWSPDFCADISPSISRTLSTTPLPTSVSHSLPIEPSTVRSSRPDDNSMSIFFDVLALLVIDA